LTLIDMDVFFRDWAAAVRSRSAAFGRTVDDSALADGFRDLAVDGAVDFGALDEGRQAILCEAAVKDPSVRAAVSAANPSLTQLFEPLSEAEIDSNRRTVLERYSLARYRVPCSRPIGPLWRSRLSNRWTRERCWTGF
jgi:hypothetical protein